jgi:hypothetical protein
MTEVGGRQTEDRWQRTEDSEMSNIQYRIMNIECRTQNVKKEGEKMSMIHIRIPIWLDLIFAWPLLLYRQWKFGYTYRRIWLGEGEFTILDQQDYYRLSKYKWYIKGNFGKFYAARNYKYDSRQTKTVSMHREIMNAPGGLLVDHRNRDGLDNRRENLRLATYSQNNCNKIKRKNTSSKFTGVCFNKQGKRWGVNISNKGKRIFLGYFDSEIDAAKAYDEAAKKYHGEFARLNFPEENYKDEIPKTENRGNQALLH